MRDRRQNPDVMPHLRQLKTLSRKSEGEGVSPFEYQRLVDLKRRIGRRLSDREGADPEAADESRRRRKSVLTRLLVPYENREALTASIIDNIKPAGFLVHTAFAAALGTHFMVRISLESESESAEFPAVVVTSISEGALTLSTSTMGMCLKFEKLDSDQRAAVSKLFGRKLDLKLNWVD